MTGGAHPLTLLVPGKVSAPIEVTDQQAALRMSVVTYGDPHRSSGRIKDELMRLIIGENGEWS